MPLPNPEPVKTSRFRISSKGMQRTRRAALIRFAFSRIETTSFPPPSDGMVPSLNQRTLHWTPSQDQNLSTRERMTPHSTSTCRVQSPRLLEASKRKVKSYSRFHLTVRIGKFRARIPFLVVQNLAIGCVCGTLFIDNHAEATLPGLRIEVF